MMARTIATASATRPPFPRKLLRDHLALVLLVWPAYAAFAFLLRLTVAQFREIEVSGWDQAEQGVRWWAGGIGGYLGWSVVTRYVTHGMTRREFWWTAVMFIAAYAAVLAGIVAVTLLLESGVYDLAGWEHGLDPGRLHTSASEVHLVFLQAWLLLTTWSAGGLYLLSSFYRGNRFGSIALVVVIVFAGISGIALSSDWGPFGAVYESLFGEDSIGGVVGVGIHLVLIVTLLGLARLIVRDLPIRNNRP